MSLPIPIPLRKSDGQISHSCSDIIKDKAIMIYPGSYPHSPGFITNVPVNYNSYNTLCSMIGKNPISICLTYSIQRSEQNDDTIYIMDDMDNNFDSTTSLSYTYTLYYDKEAQTIQEEHEFNPIISVFTKKNFWGKIIVVDNNEGNPVINSLNETIERHSF